MTAIVIGTRVHTRLYNGGYGTVIAIEGEQPPASVGTIGSVVAFDGRATFDVVFDCGSCLPVLPGLILCDTIDRLSPMSHEGYRLVRGLTVDMFGSAEMRRCRPQDAAGDGRGKWGIASLAKCSGGQTVQPERLLWPLTAPFAA
jgi:hypothetical protein